MDGKTMRTKLAQNGVNASLHDATLLARGHEPARCLDLPEHRRCCICERGFWACEDEWVCADQSCRDVYDYRERHLAGVTDPKLIHEIKRQSRWTAPDEG